MNADEFETWFNKEPIPDKKTVKLRNMLDNMTEAQRQSGIHNSNRIAIDNQSIQNTLAERGLRYGAFPEHARITQNIKRAMQDSPNWLSLSDAQREALEMLAHKAGRILNGDPNYHDSWHDIIGYTKLVADGLISPSSNLQSSEE